MTVDRNSAFFNYFFFIHSELGETKNSCKIIATKQTTLSKTSIFSYNFQTGNVHGTEFLADISNQKE